MSSVASLFEVLARGIGIGSIYALVAIGFTLIYKVTGVLNFAAGQFALLGAYFVVILTTPLALFGLDIEVGVFSAIIITIAFAVILGVLLERFVFQFFIGESVLPIIILTLALAWILEGTIQFAVGRDTRSYPEALQPDWSLPLLFGVSMSAAFTLGVVLSLITVVGLVAFFRYTVTGSILRAAASDQQAAMVLGVSINLTIIISWAIGITITMLGGVLLAMSQGSASFGIYTVGILIFAAVVLGGIDSIPGAFVGSIILGILTEFGFYYLDPIVGSGFGEILPMIALLVIIIVLPYGLFGTERIERL